MICEFGGNRCLENELVEYRLDRKPRIIIEGPQGSGKSSLARYLGERLGYFSLRGFPTGEFIKSAKSQEEICSKSVSLVSTPFEEEGAVFDRSPISQFAWMIKQGESFDNVYSCSINQLTILANSGPVIVLFVLSDLDTCLKRQDMSGQLAIKREGLAKEVEVYRQFYEKLLTEKIPGVTCYGVENGQTGVEEDFLNNGLNIAKQLLNK